MEIPIKIDDLGVPLFSETPHIFAQFSNLPSFTRRHMKISGETSPQLGPMASRCYGSRRGFGLGGRCGGDMAWRGIQMARADWIGWIQKKYHKIYRDIFCLRFLTQSFYIKVDQGTFYFGYLVFGEKFEVSSNMSIPGASWRVLSVAGRMWQDQD